jgi:hypothetical protein
MASIDSDRFYGTRTFRSRPGKAKKGRRQLDKIPWDPSQN